MDAKFIDAKAFVFLFNVIHDNDQVIKSTAVNYKEELLLDNPFYPTITYNGIELVSPFYYKNIDENTTNAFIVNPSVTVSLRVDYTTIPKDTEGNYVINNSEIADYRTELYIKYDFNTRITSIVADPGENSTNVYNFRASVDGNSFSLQLNEGNFYQQEVSAIFTDEYCVIRGDLTDIVLEVYDTNGGGLPLFNFISDAKYNQLIEKQIFYKYFQELPISVQTPAMLDLQENRAYFDNPEVSLTSFKSTQNYIECGTNVNFETYVLRMPFISYDYFYGKPAEDIFEIMNSYFRVDRTQEIINYNTQLTQTFHDTINISEKYYPYLFKENTMDVNYNPLIPIKASIFVDNSKLLTSVYEDISDLELAVKIEIIKFLKLQEGFIIDYFETDLEKLIYEKFAPVIRNINISNPTLFRVNGSAVIYEGIQSNLEFTDVLNFTPPFFHYDYDNLELEISI